MENKTLYQTLCWYIRLVPSIFQILQYLSLHIFDLGGMFIKENSEGIDRQMITRLSYMYDICTNTWRPSAPLPENTMSLASCVCPANHTMYVAGGFSALNNSRNCSSLMYSYNMDMDQWESEPPMLQGRCYFTFESVGNALYAIGGEARYQGELLSAPLPVDFTEILASIEMYNIEQKQWTEITYMHWMPSSPFEFAPVSSKECHCERYSEDEEDEADLSHHKRLRVETDCLKSYRDFLEDHVTNTDYQQVNTFQVSVECLKICRLLAPCTVWDKLDFQSLRCKQDYSLLQI